MVAFAHGSLMDLSFMVDPLNNFLFQPVLTTGVTKTIVYIILSVAAKGFFSCYLNCPLPYNRI